MAGCVHTQLLRCRLGVPVVKASDPNESKDIEKLWIHKEWKERRLVRKQTVFKSSGNT